MVKVALVVLLASCFVCTNVKAQKEDRKAARSEAIRRMQRRSKAAAAARKAAAEPPFSLDGKWTFVAHLEEGMSYPVASAIINREWILELKRANDDIVARFQRKRVDGKSPRWVVLGELYRESDLADGIEPHHFTILIYDGKKTGSVIMKCSIWLMGGPYRELRNGSLSYYPAEEDQAEMLRGFFVPPKGGGANQRVSRFFDVRFEAVKIAATRHAKTSTRSALRP